MKTLLLLSSGNQNNIFAPPLRHSLLHHTNTEPALRIEVTLLLFLGYRDTAGGTGYKHLKQPVVHRRWRLRIRKYNNHTIRRNRSGSNVILIIVNNIGTVTYTTNLTINLQKQESITMQQLNSINLYRNV